MVATALPTIVQDLGGSDFVWVGSAYALVGSAIVPLVGGLVSIWGRKPILLILMILFAIGSAVAGSAKSMNILIIGRGMLIDYSSRVQSVNCTLQHSKALGVVVPWQ